jgi:hypothetical protein
MSRSPSPTRAPDNLASDEIMSEEKGITTSDVNWDGDDDQLNPMNWAATRKWGNLSIISVMSLST